MQISERGLLFKTPLWSNNDFQDIYGFLTNLGLEHIRMSKEGYINKEISLLI